jgi:hypothetical protein
MGRAVCLPFSFSSPMGSGFGLVSWTNVAFQTGLCVPVFDVLVGDVLVGLDDLTSLKAGVRFSAADRSCAGNIDFHPDSGHVITASLEVVGHDAGRVQHQQGLVWISGWAVGCVELKNAVSWVSWVGKARQLGEGLVRVAAGGAAKPRGDPAPTQLGASLAQAVGVYVQPSQLGIGHVGEFSLACHQMGPVPVGVLILSRMRMRPSVLSPASVVASSHAQCPISSKLMQFVQQTLVM